MMDRKFFVNYYIKRLNIFIGRSPIAKLKPNTISLLVLPVAFVCAIFFSLGCTFGGGVMLLITGIIDTFDGAVAKLNNKTTKYGAVLDSTLDRYTEFIIFLGILFFFKSDWIFYIVFIAMIGSIMVSYIKARAESIGIRVEIGLMQRAERIILLAGGAILNEPVNAIFIDNDLILRITLCLLAVLNNFTAYQRLIYVKRVDNYEARN